MTKEVIHSHNSIVPRLHFSSSSSPMFFSGFRLLVCFISLPLHGYLQKKAIQCRGNLPKRAACLGLKVSACPGKCGLLRAEVFSLAQASQMLVWVNLGSKTFMERPFCPSFYFVSGSNKQPLKPTKSWMNLSYLNNNISKCIIYINNQI